MEIQIQDKILKFNYGNTCDVLDLIRFIVRKTKNNIKDFNLSNFNIDNVIKDNDFNNLLNIIFDCIGDKELEDILFKLSNNCIFNNEKITKDLFNDINNRKYFFNIAINILKENLKVFFTIKASTE